MPQTLDEKQIQGLQRLLSLLEPNSLTKEEFTANFQKVLDFLKLMMDKNMQEMAAMKMMMEKMGNDMKGEKTDEMQTMKNAMTNYCEREMTAMEKEHKMMMEMMDKKMMEIHDGKDADTQEVARLSSQMAISEVLPKIPTIEAIEKDLPKLGGSIASALEILPEEEKLRIEAIKGLKELLDELKNKPARVIGGGGGFSYLAMDQHIVDWTVLATGDDTTTQFTLPFAPNPAASLQLMIGGGEVFLTDDWTMSGLVITFLIAPPNGAKIRYKMRR